MKKILWIIPLLLIVTGCGNDKYQVSELSLSESAYYPYVNGTFKNNSNEECKTVSIDIEISSGSLKLDDNVYLLDVKPGEIKQIHDSCRSCKGLSNIKDVKIKVKDIRCY